MTRSMTCPVPSNMNPLSPNGFKFSIARIPGLTYFMQDISIPALTLPSIGMPTPYTNIPFSGESMEFDMLQLQFLIDGDMANYVALFRWLRGLGFPEDNTQYMEQVANDHLSENAASMSDATLEILGNTNSTIQTIQFVDCVITSLSALTFTSTASDVSYLIGDAVFRYSYYDFL